MTRSSPGPRDSSLPGYPLVVGVGASAGGLSAVQEFLRGIPEGAGLSIVVLLHLKPSTGGLLSELLAKATTLPVVEAEDGMPLEPDHVYAAPSRCLLTIRDDVLHLVPAQCPEERHAPIDHLLHGLAREYGESAVAVILSGDGSDGALGLRAVGEGGGFTMVQDPATARHDSMPQSALMTGAVDCVRPPDELAAELVAYAEHRKTTSGDEDTLRRDIEGALPAICEILLLGTGHNFKHYKTSTLIRRTLRRLQVLRIESAHGYLLRLRADRAEVDELFKDLLIGVTAFFRDPEAFEVLAKEVLARLVRDRSPDQALRIWVPGCATGEEAYSIAMLVREVQGNAGAAPVIQIFATDIDEQALATARLGAYPLGIADEVPPERLRRFFVRKGQHYHITKEIRELVLFSVHNLINDPPFSKLDLISCRNLLIYLGPHLQKKLIPLFHYALRPGGYLFLGPSESLSAHRELFRPIDARHRISQRLPTAVHVPGLMPGRDGPPATVRPPNVPSAGETDIYLLMQRIVLDEFAPKSVVVDEDGQIVSASGNLEKYLTISAGAFHNNLVRLVREGLAVGLRTSLALAIKERRKVVHEGLSVRTTSGMQRVMITVQPMPQMGEQSGLFLVVFQDVGLPLAREEARTKAAEDAAVLLEQLEQELVTTRADLEKTVQELEVANEELKSSNEELLSMNEELQSANEELETSKEEVQHANEALTRAHTDLENLLTSTRIATLFLDDDGCVQRITPAMGDIYNVTPSDVGRPLAHFTHRMKQMPVLPEADEVQRADGPIEDEIEAASGATFLRRVLPYRNQAGRADGVVVTFTDVTARNRAEAAVRESEQRLRRIIDNMLGFVAVLDLDGTLMEVNQAALHVGGCSREEVIGRKFWQCAWWTHDEAEVARLKNAVERAADGETLRYDAVVRVAGDGRIDIDFMIAPMRDAKGCVTHLIPSGMDITDRKRAEEALREADRRKDEFLATLAHELRNPLAPISNAVEIFRRIGPQEPTLESAREMIERQVSHMVRLVDDLLDVSRITLGKVQLQKQPIDVADVVRQALDTSGPILEARRHDTQVILPLVPIRVEGDLTRLGQVVGNLLNNAAKYTDAGGTIRLVVERDPGDAKFVLLRVRDTGRGIDPAALPHVFDLFYQVDRNLDRSEGGLGIGLSLVRTLVQMHGGAVRAYSDGRGTGSEFVVRLPVLPDEPKVQPVEGAVVAESATPGVRVLVVDDNLDAAESMAMLLEFDGHEVLTAHDGVAAVEIALRERPEVVLLDIGLPGQNGYDACRVMREHGLSDTLIVAMTGYGQDEDRRLSQVAGFDAHEVKPLNLKAIRRLVAERSGRR
ncbi:CheR family methyltransferase [Polyangium sp. y55x31]|uniref:CheR family methyltransferase n=1 Tax=Polyangium sp. y55x31 TaxID=3042688 RepID=UPI0024831C7D|nr:CheR family methyltransferase [Polyangium sp. y55x31]MDI1475903.1 CheR family methyltransferase [Polyangium sp. y55x31]